MLAQFLQVPVIATTIILSLSSLTMLAFFLRGRLARKMSGFRFSLRTLLLGMLALGAGGVAYVHRSPFVPTGKSWSVGRQLYVHAALEFSPDGRRLLFIKDGTPWVWDFDTKAKPVPVEAVGYATGARFSIDGESVLVFNHDRIARIGMSGEVLEQSADLSSEKHKQTDEFQNLRILDVSSNGQHALVEESTLIRSSSGGLGKRSDSPSLLRVISCAGQSVGVIEEGFLMTPDSGISADGGRACWFTERPAELAVHDLGSSLTRKMEVHSNSVFQNMLTLTRDGGMTAYAGLGHYVEIADLNRMCPLEKFFVPGVQAAHLSADGSYLATVSRLSDLTIWQARRRPGAFGPLDFPELWLAGVLGLCFISSLVRDFFALRKTASRNPA